MLRRAHSAHSIRVTNLTVAAAAAVAALAMAAAPLWAGVKWDGGAGNGNWNADNNWDPNGVPAANLAIVLAGNVQTNTTQNLGNPFELNSLTFDTTAGGFDVGGNPLKFSGNAPAIVQDADAIHAIAAPVQINAPVLALKGTGTRQIRLHGPISQVGGNRGVTVDSPATWLLTAANTYQGDTTLNSGTIAVENGQALGPAGKLVMKGGTLRSSTNAPAAGVTLGNALTIDGNVQFNSAIADAKPLTITGAVTLTGNRELKVVKGSNDNTPFGQASLTRFNGDITEDMAGRAMTKSGNGQLIFNGQAKYTGATTVSGGLLTINQTMGALNNRVGPITADMGAKIALGNGVTVFAKNGVFMRTRAGAFMKVGNSPGVATFDSEDSSGGVVFEPGSTFELTLDGPTPGGTPGLDHGQLNVLGSLALGGSYLDAELGYVPSSLDKLFILTNDAVDSTIGQFAQGGSIDLVSSVNSAPYQFQISYTADALTGSLSGGNDVVLYGASVVPEPATTALLAGLGLPLMRRRRRAPVEGGQNLCPTPASSYAS